MLTGILASDLTGRLIRTALQVLFTSIMVNGVPIFTEDQINTLLGALGLIISLIPTVYASVKTARAKRAAELLNEGQVEKAKIVAAGQDKPRTPSSPYIPSRSR